MNFPALLLLLLSDIPPRGEDHNKRNSVLINKDFFCVSNLTNLCVNYKYTDKSRPASFFFQMKSLSTSNKTPAEKSKGQEDVCSLLERVSISFL